MVPGACSYGRAWRWPTSAVELAWKTGAPCEFLTFLRGGFDDGRPPQVVALDDVQHLEVVAVLKHGYDRTVLSIRSEAEMWAAGAVCGETWGPKRICRGRRSAR
eukprot:282172-Hanusia_phi.AAC.1